MKPNGEEPKEVGGSSLTPLTDIEYNNLLSFHFLSISPEFVQIWDRSIHCYSYKQFDAAFDSISLTALPNWKR